MLFVSYRENSLFNQYVPQILEGLPVVGQFIVPAGVAVKSVEGAYKEALRDALKQGAKLLLTDQTCRPHDIYMAVVGRQLDWRNRTELDDLFRMQVQRWLKGNTVEQNLQWFAQRVAAGREIKKIIVVRDKINDHAFAGNSYPSPTADEVGTVVLEIFPNAKLEIENTLMDASYCFHDADRLLILDRHCGIKNLMFDCRYNSLTSWPYKAAMYLLPFETCAAQLIDQGDASFDYRFDIEAMREIIKQQLS